MTWRSVATTSCAPEGPGSPCRWTACRRGELSWCLSPSSCQSDLPQACAHALTRPMLNAVNPELKSKLSDRLGQEGLPDDASSYLREPRGRWQGKGLVVAPATTQEVAAVVRLCDRAAVGPP